MDNRHLEKTLSRRSRILIHGLIISGTLNIALIATFITFVLKERKGMMIPTLTTQEKIKVIRLRNEDVLKAFAEMPYDHLVRELYDESHIEQGQRRCDLALAALTAFHDFDIEGAFSGFPLEKREVFFDDQSIVLFPGISKERLEGVRLFARREVWPLTSKGLFTEIQKRETVPQSLKEAFLVTDEFFEIKRTFSRLPYTFSDEVLFDLVASGDWESLKRFDVEVLPNFLIPRLEKGSKLAAYLLVLLEKEYALTSLDDIQMEILLSLLTEKTPEIEAFLHEITAGIRSEKVQALAGKPLENPPRSYVIQTGDNLWKIAQMFGVKVEVIQEMNQLESETLQPGRELFLPPE